MVHDPTASCKGPCWRNSQFVPIQLQKTAQVWSGLPQSALSPITCSGASSRFVGQHRKCGPTGLKGENRTTMFYGMQVTVAFLAPKRSRSLIPTYCSWIITLVNLWKPPFPPPIFWASSSGLETSAREKQYGIARTSSLPLEFRYTTTQQTPAKLWLGRLALKRWRPPTDCIKLWRERASVLRWSLETLKL